MNQLINCYACNKEISVEATSCLQCGAPRKQEKSSNLGGFLIIIFVIFLMYGCVTTFVKTESVSGDASRSAKASCVVGIKKNLNDADSAKFDLYDNFLTTVDKQGIYNIAITFRAKNGFGAYKKSMFECVATPEGDSFAVHLTEIY